LENIEVLKKAEVEMAFIAKHKIEPLFFTDNRFPARLSDCNDAPLLLYYKGTSDLNQTKVLGVVGTRNITDYGKEITKK
jgi:DNA processing protein